MIGPGFSFIGGNAVGIFVHEVYSDCFVGGTHSLQRGDHILEVGLILCTEEMRGEMGNDQKNRYNHYSVFNEKFK